MRFKISEFKGGEIIVDQLKEEDFDVVRRLRSFIDNNNFTDKSKEKIDYLYLSILRYANSDNMETVSFSLEEDTVIISIDITKFNQKYISCKINFN